MPAVLALVPVLALIVLAFARGRGRGHAQRRERQACERIRTRFSRFVHAVRGGSVDEDDIERFLAETAEVNALFYGGTVPRLRLELHDQASRLVRLEAALVDWRGASELEAVIAEGCAERRAWFDRTAGKIDALFDERRIAPLERFNRAIGA